MYSEDFKQKLNNCLGCTNPKCSTGCPINMEIPQIIKYAKEGKLEGAYRKILEKSYFGSVYSRVCHHDNQCEGNCVRGISSTPVKISEIEKYVSDWGIKNIKEDMCPVTLPKVAIVGSGPAGLTCAIELRKKGYDVTIFEKESELGGILRYGIPEYRLPNKVVDDVINNILQYGIKVEKNKTYGVDFNYNDLKNNGFEAVFLGIGNYIPNLLNIPGIELNGVYGANDFLKRIDEINFENVVVIGGGNVAMDVCRMAKLKGARNVTVVYRKTKDMMKANKSEIKSAEDEEINFKFESLPTQILGENNVQKVVCNDNTIIDVDTVVMAVGSLPNYEQIGKEIELNDNVSIKVDEYGETNICGVFAGGDIVEKRATVCDAIKTAKIAAEGIDKKLRGIL